MFDPDRLISQDTYKCRLSLLVNVKSRFPSAQSFTYTFSSSFFFFTSLFILHFLTYLSLPHPNQQCPTSRPSLPPTWPHTTPRTASTSLSEARSTTAPTSSTRYFFFSFTPCCSSFHPSFSYEKGGGLMCWTRPGPPLRHRPTLWISDFASEKSQQ